MLIGGMPRSGRPVRMTGLILSPFTSSDTRTERVRSGPVVPPVASRPWQKPQYATNSGSPAVTSLAGYTTASCAGAGAAGAWARGPDESIAASRAVAPRVMMVPGKVGMRMTRHATTYFVNRDAAGYSRRAATTTRANRTSALSLAGDASRATRGARREFTVYSSQSTVWFTARGVHSSGSQSPKFTVSLNTVNSRTVNQTVNCPLLTVNFPAYQFTRTPKRSTRGATTALISFAVAAFCWR